MRRRGRWSVFWILIPVVAVGIFFLLSVNYLINPNLSRNILQRSLSLSLGREVTVGKARISLWGGVGVVFEDFRVKDRSQAFDLLQSKRLILKAKILPLFRREVRWKRVVLDGPTLHLVRDRNGRFNFFDRPWSGDELKASETKMLQILSTAFGGSFTFRDGTIVFSDESVTDSPLVTEISSFNFHLSEVSFRRAFPFRMNGKVSHATSEGHFSLEGKIRNIREDMDLSKGKIEAEVEMKGIDILHFWPYLKRGLPMKTISATLDLKGRYEGTFSGVGKISAKIKFRDVVYDHPQVFATILKPDWMNIGFDLDYDSKEIRIPRVSVELPELWVKAKGRIYGIGTEEMGMEAEAQSGPFDLAEGKKLIPYRIITPDVSDALFRAEGSGPVQILSVKLSGKMAEIDHCDLLQNAHTLSVEMTVGGARLKFPWNLPPLENFKGHLVFKGGHLSVREAEGRVFHSSLEKVNATFHQLLFVPTLQFNCEGRLDLTDLPALLKTDLITGEFSQALSSIDIRSGRAEYRLSAKGVLQPPYYFEHEELYRLSKVRFNHPRIPFSVLIGEGKIDLSNQNLQWSEAKVDFGNSSVMMNGSWRHGEKARPLDVTARGRVDLKSLVSLLSQASFFPQEIQSKAKGMDGLSGTGYVSFKGKSLSKPPYFSYEGEFAPREVHLLPKGASFPFVFREGVLSFSNSGVDLSKLKVQFLNSSLLLDGSIQEGSTMLSTKGSIDLRNLAPLLRLPFVPDRVRVQMEGVQELTGEAEVRFRWSGGEEDWVSSLKEGEAKLKGVSLHHQRIPLPLSQVEGTLLLSSGGFRFEGLRGSLGDSRFTLSGAVPRTSLGLKPLGELDRWLSFKISSPFLDLDLLFPKKVEQDSPSFEKVRDWLSGWSVEGKVEADRVRYRGLLFQGLKIEMKSVEGKLLFRPFQFEGAGGDLWGEGWIEPTQKGIRFEMRPRLSNMEAKAFLRVLLRKGEDEKVALTGRVHMDKVELRGEGMDFQELKKSLSGSLRLELEHGVIERANILAKIFSILNVSQLFKGRFPDLKTKGLPYRSITATIHVKEGVASTEDFLVDSDAIKITLLGKVDVTKNEIDARIGVHPLITLDTVLSHLPIAGYILTGKDKAFLSYVYEVGGDLNDPKVEAIPIKSAGEGFFGIVQRLLETPLRPFQKPPQPEKKNGNR